jgi:hypothetical protein
MDVANILTGPSCLLDPFIIERTVSQPLHASVMIEIRLSMACNPDFHMLILSLQHAAGHKCTVIILATKYETGNNAGYRGDQTETRQKRQVISFLPDLWRNFSCISVEAGLEKRRYLLFCKRQRSKTA